MAVHELFAYLRAKDAEKMIAFCKRAFGATEKFRLVEPSGRIGHAELMLGNAVLMLSDEFPEWDIYAPEADAKEHVRYPSSRGRRRCDDRASGQRRGAPRASASGSVLRRAIRHRA